MYNSSIVNFLAGWIVLQMVMIGIVGGTMINEIAADKYDCNKKVEFAPISTHIVTLVFPLAFFAEDVTVDYCKDHEQEK